MARMDSLRGAPDAALKLPRRYVQGAVALGGAIVAALALGACGSSTDNSTPSSTAPSQVQTPLVQENLRNQRYCEIIPSVQDGLTVTTEVYNTLGLNDCPQDKWVQITEEEVNAEYGAKQTKLNGPRFWTMDSILAMGSSVESPTFTFGGPDGIEMQRRAVLTTKINEATVGEAFYAPNQVARDTVFVFNAGEPVFELTDPEGNVYMMQSYTTVEDGSLTYDQLPDLASKLALPEGWIFSTRVLDAEFRLTTEATDGFAFVVNDNLYNSYQRSVSAS